MAPHQRRKYSRDVVGAVLGDDDIVVRATGNGIVIESNNHEVRDDDEQHVSEEVIQVFANGTPNEPLHTQHVKIGAQLYTKGINGGAQQTAAICRNGPGGFIGGGIAPICRCMSTP